MDNPEFHSLPPHSSHPPPVIPPATVAETESIPSSSTVNQVPSVVSGSQSPTPQPITSSSSLLDTASSPVVTSAEGVQTPFPPLLERGNTSANSVMNGSVGGRNKGSSARSCYSKASRRPPSSRKGRSDGAGGSEETIILARGEQARALAEARVKAQAAQAEQQHIREVQEKQLAIKRRGIELQLEGRRKESETKAEEDRIRAEQELLTLENEQLQVQSESWIRNQETINEALITEAGAGAEAAAIIQETNSRSASPNLGLESLTTNEKMSRFLGTPEPEDCSQEDYFNPEVFNLSAFDCVRPKQTMVTTHPEATTTTTPANNVYVPPPRLSYRAEPPMAAPFPRVSQTFTPAFYNIETMTAPANDVNVPPPPIKFQSELRQSCLASNIQSKSDIYDSR